MWTPPSAKALDKLPVIEIVGSEVPQQYLDWINQHPEIPRTVPPLMRDFVLRYSREYFDPARDKSPRVHNYAEIVHYSDDLTALDLCHMIDGKKVLTIHSNYIDYKGIVVHAMLQAPPCKARREEKENGNPALYRNGEPE